MQWAGLLLLLALAAVAVFAPLPPAPPLAQGHAFAALLAVAATLNLCTLLPVRQAMLRSPLRVFALSGDAVPLLRAHLLAHALALARALGMAPMGLAARYLACDAWWFWPFAAAAAGALALLWPSRRAVHRLLAVPP